MTTVPELGSIVRCRDREWVVLSSPEPEVVLLRPLAGSAQETCGIYLPLAQFGYDHCVPAVFPVPTPDDFGDAIGTSLLYDAARLLLREGAAPFRSLGKISVRPRSYQFVPLLMALRLDPIRMLIADDVGVGKTVEALLIARELVDRKEITRFCILCPPYLCDQWKKELSEKFHIEAVVIRAGTVGKLEREIPSGGTHSVFSHYPFVIASIDYVKSERHRETFVKDCPRLVIVDEAHGSAKPSGIGRVQQQRYELLQRIAADQERHLLLLTATPHSGVEAAFLSLLGLLKPKFSEIELHKTGEEERSELARHFVQRRRVDLKNWLDEVTPFPDRIPEEVLYSLSPEYDALFRGVYDFSRDIVRTGQTLSGWKQRIRYWTALALLRCVMSSPAAAVATLRNVGKGLPAEEENTEPDESDETLAPFIYEPSDQDAMDAQPSHIVKKGEDSLQPGEKGKISRFEKMAEDLKGVRTDRKLAKCVEVVHKLLDEGYNPIVWCRYIPTSDYVAEHLEEILKRQYKDIRVISITGALGDDERRLKVEELGSYPRRVLVATDCLSEGINLQEQFDAVIHYDLPWNPNRLEQREGRVDRFGQQKGTVKAVMLYGKDNPIDVAVLEVLLRKARTISNRLGISVPVPVESGSIIESMITKLFLESQEGRQLTLDRFLEGAVPTDEGEVKVKEIHQRWDAAAEREKESRTKFAQRAIKPTEIKQELEASDAVLGEPGAVQKFVMNACQRLGAALNPFSQGIFTLSGAERLPEGIQRHLPSPQGKGNTIRISFQAPAPEGIPVMGRNHPFVAALAEYLFEESLLKGKDATAPRCGVIRTRAVTQRTALLLLRGRFSLQTPESSTPLLAEEVYVKGFTGSTPGNLTWLPDQDALKYLTDTRPDANISPQEKREVLAQVLPLWNPASPGTGDLMKTYAADIHDSHRRVRASAKVVRRGLTVQPHLPPDLIGVMVLLPVPAGVKP